MFADEGHLSQYSNTILRICGMKETCPLAGRDVSCARSSGLVGASLEAMAVWRGQNTGAL